MTYGKNKMEYILNNLIAKSLEKKALIWENDEELMTICLSALSPMSTKGAKNSKYPYDLFKKDEKLIDEIVVCLCEEANRKKLSFHTVSRFRYVICSILTLKPKIKTFVDLESDTQIKIKDYILANQEKVASTKTVFEVLRKCFAFYNPQKECFFYNTKKSLIPKRSKSSILPSEQHAQAIAVELERKIKRTEKLFELYFKEKECLDNQLQKNSYFSVENFLYSFAQATEEKKHKIANLFKIMHGYKIEQILPKNSNHGVDIFNLSSIKNIVYFIESFLVERERFPIFEFTQTPLCSFTNIQLKYSLSKFLEVFFDVDISLVREILQMRFASRQCIIPFILLLMEKKGINPSVACSLPYEILNKKLLDYKDGDQISIHAFKSRANNTIICKIDRRKDCFLYNALLLSQRILDFVRTAFPNQNLFFFSFLESRGRSKIGDKDISRFLKIFIKKHQIKDKNGKLLDFTPKQFRLIYASRELLNDCNIERLQKILSHSNLDIQSIHYYKSREVQSFFERHLRKFVEDEYKRAVTYHETAPIPLTMGEKIFIPLEAKSNHNFLDCFYCKHSLITKANLPVVFFLYKHFFGSEKKEIKSMLQTIFDTFELGENELRKIEEECAKNIDVFEKIFRELVL